MLINCPECGKQISDQVTSCIHCGYPLISENKYIYNINGSDYDFTAIFSKIHDDNITPASIIREISDKCNIPIYEAKEIYFKIINKNELQKNIRCEQKQPINKPKCPTCSSTNLKKISTTSKVVNTAMFGIFGTKRHKTFHCDNCGYEW